MRQLGDVTRMLVTAGVLVVPGALLGFSLGGPPAGLGASGGVLVAGLYAWSFLRSHVSRISRERERERFFDRRLAAGAGLRLAAAAVTGAAMFLVGREAFVAYLAAFGATFALLLGMQAPAVLRRLERLRVGDERGASL